MKKEVKTRDKDRQELERLARGRNTPQKVVLRAKIVLGWMDGKNKRALAKELGTTRPTVYLWIGRYEEAGVQALIKDASRPGRKPEMEEAKEREIVEATLYEQPPGGVTQWSCRSMAEKMGVSRMAVQRVWRKYNLRPHRVKNFKISNDPHFVEKVTDIVGLYLDPPEHALVLSVDEKTQIQALDRTQPSLPMRPGKCGTMTHDYKRNGTTTLFCALDVLQGTVIGSCMPKHRTEEFLKFLRLVDRKTDKDLDVHLILDNYTTHKTKRVEDWLAKHPRFHLHFTPTSASWLNMVEGFFSQITNKRIRRGAFKSVPELIDAIMEFIEHHNENPTVFVWTKSADTILAKVNQCKEA